MRVLITGGTGFVGQHLVALLNQHKHEVFATYLTRPPEPIPGAELLACDIRNRDQVLQVIRHSQPQHVYHLSGFSSVVRSFADVRQVWDTNFLGAMNLLEGLSGAAPQARTLLVGSSQCYGRVAAKRLPILEDQPLSPQSPYAASKAAAEMLGSQFFHTSGLEVIRTRPFNHTGPGQSPDFVCADLAQQVVEIEAGLLPPVLRVGNIRVKRDFSDARDVVRAYELLLDHGVPGEVYNVASGRGVSIAAIVEHLRSFCSSTFQVEVEETRVRSDEVSEVYGSNRKLRHATGWKPEYSLRHTLFDVYMFWKTAIVSQDDRRKRLFAARES